MILNNFIKNMNEVGRDLIYDINQEIPWRDWEERRNRQSLLVIQVGNLQSEIQKPYILSQLRLVH
jgi:hypothetical protein